jgi:hypothetical protein
MRTPSSSSDMSDRYNNLKAAWDSLMEAAEHASPQAFHVVVTVVLEQLKRDKLKSKKRRAKEMNILSLLPPGLLLLVGLLL